MDAKRKQHTLAQLRERLSLLDQYERFVISKDTVEMALWWQYVFDNPDHAHNHIRCIRCSADDLRILGAGHARIRAVGELISATVSTSRQNHRDDRLIADISNAELGVPLAHFKGNTDSAWRAQKKEFFQGLSYRGFVFHREEFGEQNAQANMEFALAERPQPQILLSASA